MPLGVKTPRTRTLASIFQELRTAHAGVDAEDDAISAGLRKFEENLARILRVRVSTLISSEDVGHGTSYWRQLAFTKQEAGWKLVVESGYDHDDPAGAAVTPLLSASREVRTEVVASGKLQALLETAVTELKSQQLAKKQARALLDQLNADLLAEVEASDDFGGGE